MLALTRWLELFLCDAMSEGFPCLGELFAEQALFSICKARHVVLKLGSGFGQNGRGDTESDCSDLSVDFKVVGIVGLGLAPEEGEGFLGPV